MAWHSSTHEHNGVACTDCHNPHPKACTPDFVDIDRYQVKRPQRLAMSVQEPEACYKCHPKIVGLGDLPSHHPIKEGKMVCSDCHDPHGQALGDLKEETINLVCYKCHAEKQGPFAYEHPPVTENCTICHEPHGTVNDNLLIAADDVPVSAVPRRPLQQQPGLAEQPDSQARVLHGLLGLPHRSTRLRSAVVGRYGRTFHAVRTCQSVIVVGQVANLP